MRKIEAQQIKLIHTLKNAIKMDDEVYRDMLHGYSNQMRKIRSSKDLSYGEASHLIKKLTKLAKDAGAWKDYRKRDKYEDLGTRPGMATPKQLRMLEAMWKDVSIVKNATARQKAFNKFIHRIVKVNDPKWVEDWMVEKIIRALEAMGAEATRV